MAISEVQWTEGLTMRFIELHGWSISESKLDAGTEVASPDGVLREWFHTVEEALTYVESVSAGPR